jgi:hypothetical protein
MSTFNFQPSTWTNVITPLRAILEQKAITGESYPTLGHFYREIELLKFPWLGTVKPGTYYYSKHGRNVYSQQQYESIRDYCEDMGWVRIVPNVNRKNSYVVLVNTDVIVEAREEVKGLLNLGEKYYPKQPMYPTTYVIPMSIEREGEEDIVLFQDPNGTFQANHSGFCPLPLWAFIDMFSEMKPRKSQKPSLPTTEGPRKNSATSNGYDRINHDEELLSRAFGVPDEWSDNTIDFIESFVEDGDKITVAAINLIKKARIEELNEDNMENFSDYEMKLFYSGFLLANYVAQQRSMIAAAKLTADIISMMTRFSADKKNGMDLEDILRMIQNLRNTDDNEE